MSTRKNKTQKGGPWILRAIVAANLGEYMERYFEDKPEISNRNVWLAQKAKVSPETIRRTLLKMSGINVDSLEAIATVLGVQPYKLLMPSAKLQRALSVDPDDLPANLEVPEQLQRKRRS